jgi:hypothetical protein
MPFRLPRLEFVIRSDLPRLGDETRYDARMTLARAGDPGY